MKISEIFTLGKAQPELDFVDVDPDKDKRLFLDPHFIGRRKDPWSNEAARYIQSFFSRTIKLIRARQIADARALFENLHEPNETCLGMSRGRPSGRGIGNQNAEDLFDSLLKSRAAVTGRITDLQDCHIFVPNFGKDKLSDMTTNIIRRLLIDYTQEQAKLHGIPLRPGTSSGWYWNPDSLAWESTHEEMLEINGQKILLVPKGVVSYCKDYTPDEYYGHFVLDYLANEQLSINSALVKTTIKKDGTVKKKVTKKDLRTVFPPDKEFLLEFSEKHSKVFESFKKIKSSIPPRSLTDESIMGDEFTQQYLNQLVDSVADQLKDTPAGSETADEYHKAMIGVLELLFYPALTHPQGEVRIHEGRKRIDITFDNTMVDEVFGNLELRHKISCPYIIIECKNYTGDPSNPELDQLSGRFSDTRGRFGLLVCRNIDKLPLFLKRCADTFKDGRGLIVPLTDEDMLDALYGLKHEQNSIYNVIADRIRKIVLS